jgi:hypothetical protein
VRESLSKHLIEKAHLTEEKHNLRLRSSAFMALIFTPLFESAEEKPIICYTGVKASGKGLISTAIGKILFGPGFLPSHLPDDLRDLQVALIGNYYLVLDNVDSIVRSHVTDALCRAATGERISKRKLYTDSDELKIRPRVFLSITSRDPRFKRDDLVDRLIIFCMAKILNPKSRAFLFKDILAARPALWLKYSPTSTRSSPYSARSVTGTPRATSESLTGNSGPRRSTTRLAKPTSGTSSKR